MILFLPVIWLLVVLSISTASVSITTSRYLPRRLLLLLIVLLLRSLLPLLMVVLLLVLQVHHHDRVLIYHATDPEFAVTLEQGGLCYICTIMPTYYYDYCCWCFFWPYRSTITGCNGNDATATTASPFAAFYYIWWCCCFETTATYYAGCYNC